MSDEITMIVGLEVHVQLLTDSKLYCGCKTKFGAPPNTQTCPICIGMPGTLPVMNRKAFSLALRAATALNCEIASFTKWDRKNYYYPDLPKGYQISQYDLPFSSGGHLMIEDPADGQLKRIGITRVHLEEDAGKNMHDEQAGTGDSRVDLNRAGTPLCEIVSEPDIRSPEHAKAYLQELRLLLRYLGVSDCEMQEGSLRVDANVNLHIKTENGVVATPIVEVKNVNSFRAVERALQYEGERQLKLFRETGRKKDDPGVTKQTRGWDDPAGVTRAQREKEDVADYRYFPEPDLVPVTVSDDEKALVRANIGEMPAALRVRLVEEFGITEYDADVLVNHGQDIVNYFLELTRLTSDAKMAANWMQQDILRTLKDMHVEIDAFPLRPKTMADLLLKIKSGDLNVTRAKDVYASMVESGKSVEQVMADMGIERVDTSELETLCQELLEQNPHIVADVKAGKEKAVSAIVGQAKKRNRNVDPGEVRTVCLKLIERM
jgi:aspartyl-tRNA(Asn)/glutamyl-tRNA(Gln) amidotransferase subunit B